MESLDISLEAVRLQVEQIVGHGGDSPKGHIPCNEGPVWHLLRLAGQRPFALANGAEHGRRVDRAQPRRMRPRRAAKQNVMLSAATTAIASNALARSPAFHPTDTSDRSPWSR